MGAMASQITCLTIVYSAVHSGADQRKHQSSVPLYFVWEIHWWPVNSPHKGSVMRKMFPFDDVIMTLSGSLPYQTRTTWYKTPHTNIKRFNILYISDTVMAAQIRLIYLLPVLSGKCWHNDLYSRCSFPVSLILQINFTMITMSERVTLAKRLS